LAFGTYDTRVHPRVGVLIEGLTECGDEVREVVVPLGLDTAERVSLLRRPWRLPILALRLIRCWGQLAIQGRRMARAWPPDAILVGYLGHFDVILAHWLFKGVPVVLDHLIFAADTAADRGETGRWKQRLLRHLDLAAVRRADLVVLDTAEHAAMLPPEAAERGVVAPVGTGRAWFAPEDGANRATEAERTAPLRVIFFGLFTPLQGASVIGQALALLADDPGIQTLMVGSGQDLPAARAAAGASHTVQWRPWVPIEALPSLLASQDVCLGIFGDGPKAHRVVPNKVFQGAAAGCAIVTSDTAPQRAALGKAAEYVPPGDAQALAGSLRRLAKERNRLADLRSRSRSRAAQYFAPPAVVADLRTRMLEITHQATMESR
jgi:glycosyltransferase involved in cell wall biosynthesis